MPSIWKILPTLLVPASLVLGWPTSAADDDVPDFEPVPFGVLLDRVRADFPGSILSVELDDEEDAPSGWVYEVKVLTAGGDVLELEYDARTLEWLDDDDRDD